MNVINAIQFLKSKPISGDEMVIYNLDGNKINLHNLLEEYAKIRLDFQAKNYIKLIKTIEDGN